MKRSRHIPQRGFTIYFAVLVASLALAVGLAIFDLLSRELALSQTATQSQYAIYAADTGAECALYWDSKYGPSQDQSAFGTSSDSSWGSGVNCYGRDISLIGTPGTTFAAPPGSGTSLWTAWTTSSSVSAATTTFYMLLGPAATSPCVQVIVAKRGNPSQTTITSRGYNTCLMGGVVRIERALQVRY